MLPIKINLGFHVLETRGRRTFSRLSVTGFPSPLITSMPDAPRSRLQVTLAIVLLVALVVFVPGFLYFTELALRELRFMWWLILLLGGAIWLLTRLGRKK